MGFDLVYTICNCKLHMLQGPATPTLLAFAASSLYSSPFEAIRFGLEHVVLKNVSYHCQYLSAR